MIPYIAFTFAFSSYTMGEVKCTVKETAGVECKNDKDSDGDDESEMQDRSLKDISDVRLVDGQSDKEGLVEVR